MTRHLLLLLRCAVPNLPQTVLHLQLQALDKTQTVLQKVDITKPTNQRTGTEKKPSPFVTQNRRWLTRTKIMMVLLNFCSQIYNSTLDVTEKFFPHLFKVVDRATSIVNTECRGTSACMSPLSGVNIATRPLVLCDPPFETFSRQGLLPNAPAPQMT